MTLDHNLKKKLIKEFLAQAEETLFFFRPEVLEEKLKILSELEVKNTQFIFPVKTFPFPDSLSLIGRYLKGFDVSNTAEYDLIKKYLRDDSIVWCSSPYPVKIKSSQNIIYDGTDSLRINFNSTRDENSRFGNDIQNCILKSNLHCHLGFQGNKSQDYIDAAKKIRSKIQKSSVPINAINLGGGFEFQDTEELKLCLTEVSDILDPYPIFYEPGNWLTKGSVGIIGKILNKEEFDGITILTNSVSNLAHLKWAGDIKINILGSDKKKYNRVILCGPTCSEEDRLFDLENIELAVEIGDFILFTDVSSYSYAWSTEFNGIPKPNIVRID